MREIFPGMWLLECFSCIKHSSYDILYLQYAGTLQAEGESEMAAVCAAT